MARRVAIAGVLLLSLATSAPARADAVYLVDGRVLEVENAWFEGRELRYSRGGEQFRVPREAVVRVESPGARTEQPPDFAESDAPDAATPASSARIRLHYDGGADQPLGRAVLRVLDQAWEEYSRRLGFSPGQPVTVVLQTAAVFRDTTRAPEWAAAWNDGTIRVPVAGLAAPTPGLVRVLRHELAHSFVVSRAGANCPTWLHEGIAQWLEGGDPDRRDAALAIDARSRRLDRLQSLEAPFVHLSQADAARAYAISLSTVAHIVRRHGEDGVRRIVAALEQGRPVADAVPLALAISYDDLQRDWERHLLAQTSTTRPKPPR